MDGNKKSKKQVYRSMLEFEKKFLPKSFEKRMSEQYTNPQALGISLAKESLYRISKGFAV